MSTVLITGASAGIGRATAVRFLELGWSVAATSVDTADMGDLAAHENCVVHRLDVTEDDATVAAVLSDIESQLGPIDCLVNNAGYGVFGVFEAASEQQAAHQFEVNVLGAMRVARLALRQLRATQGVMIVLASTVGRIGAPLQSLYNSTKFALEGWAESLSYELGHVGVRVKIVEPGNITSDFFSGLDTITVTDTDPYASYAKRILDKHVALNTKGSPPSTVANTIVKAATSDDSRLRYPSGRDATQFLAMRKLLPDRAIAAVVGKVIGS